MTTNADNAYGPVPATEPLALRLSEGLGRVVPERAAFDRWQADSAPELWENNRASLGGTAWATWVAAKEHARSNMEFAGWQKRLTHPVYGAEDWAFCDATTADFLRGRPGYEVRAVWATRPNAKVSGVPPQD